MSRKLLELTGIQMVFMVVLGLYGYFFVQNEHVVFYATAMITSFWLGQIYRGVRMSR